MAQEQPRTLYDSDLLDSGRVLYRVHAQDKVAAGLVVTTDIIPTPVLSEEYAKVLKQHPFSDRSL